jgi:T5orf172 domain
MSTSIDAGQPRPRLVSQGQAFAYVLPCACEDILKVGFSRDPVTRMQTLHPRYFDFFDLETAFLIETDSVAEAREIECRLMDEVMLHRAPAPLIVPIQAAGHTEWFRGAAVDVTELAKRISSEGGYTMHAPLRAWLRDALMQRSDLLFEWSLCAWLQLDCMTETADRHRVTRSLRNALDAYVAADLSLAECISRDVLDWYNTPRNHG